MAGRISWKLEDRHELLTNPSTLTFYIPLFPFLFFR